MKKFTNALMLGAISIATIVGISSCNKTANMTIDPAKATLHSGDTVLLSVVGAPAEVSFETTNNYVAHLSGDTLFAFFVGEAVVTATSGDQKATCAVTVTPEYTLFTEPVTEWGYSAAELKAKHGGEATEQEGTILYVQDQENGVMELYQFDNDALASSMLVAAATERNKDIVYFLVERYAYAGEDNGVLYFVNALDIDDVTVVIQLDIIELQGQQFYRAWYRPYSSQQNMPALKIQKGKHNLPALR